MARVRNEFLDRLAGVSPMEYKSRTDLEALREEPESDILEFKSSRPLRDQESKEATKFIRDTLSKAISGFLNSKGGTLIVGMTDKVPRQFDVGIQLVLEKFQSRIVDMIHPAVADLVQVKPIRVDETNNTPGYAFCIQVREGNTAYQAGDRIYYARSNTHTVAMEDKDIRLRMLAGNVPRVSISLKAVPSPINDTSKICGETRWLLSIKNVGIRTIERAVIVSSFRPYGFSPAGAKLVSATMSLGGIERFLRDEGDKGGLMPQEEFCKRSFFLATNALAGCSDEASLLADVCVYIDDGLPATISGYDLMDDVRSLRADGYLI